MKRQEGRLTQKEQALDKKIDEIDRRVEELDDRDMKLQMVRQQLEHAAEQHRAQLETIARMTQTKLPTSDFGW